MNTFNEIVARVKELDETLQWQALKANPSSDVLVSTKTGRVLATVSPVQSGFETRRSGVGYDSQHAAILTSAEAARTWMKMVVARDILSDEIRSSRPLQ